jgi:predicted acyl esterase
MANAKHSAAPIVAAFACGCALVAGGAAASGARLERDVAVPMRDGVVLRAEVYRPSGDGRHPVLVFRTPYGKHFAEQSDGVHLKAVERGYAVVLQDVRGRYASDGHFDPYRQEGRDGYDTIEWAASQPWSDGRVGTYGLSYPGAVQWLAPRRDGTGHDVLLAAPVFLREWDIRPILAAVDLPECRPGCAATAGYAGGRRSGGELAASRG